MKENISLNNTEYDAKVVVFHEEPLKEANKVKNSYTWVKRKSQIKILWHNSYIRHMKFYEEILKSSI